MTPHSQPSSQDFNARCRSQLEFVLCLAPADSRDRMLALADELRLFRGDDRDGAADAREKRAVPRPPGPGIKHLPARRVAQAFTGHREAVADGSWRLTTLSRGQIAHNWGADEASLSSAVEAALADGSPEAVGVPCARPEDLLPDGSRKPTVLRNCFVDREDRSFVVLVNPESRVIVSIVPRCAPKEDYALRRVTTLTPSKKTSKNTSRADLLALVRRQGFDVEHRNNRAFLAHPTMEGYYIIPAGEIGPEEFHEHVRALESRTGMTIGSNTAR